MKYKHYYTLLFVCIVQLAAAQLPPPDYFRHIEQTNIKHYLDTLQAHYIYLPDKNISMDSFRRYYDAQIETVQNSAEGTNIHRQIICEFQDDQLYINKATDNSFNPFSPIYATFEAQRAYIKQVWVSQLQTIPLNLIGAEVLKINGQPLDKLIDEFPTHFLDKTKPEVRTWILNKLLSGPLNFRKRARWTVQLPTGDTLTMSRDTFPLHSNIDLLQVQHVDNFTIIRINNSLGNPEFLPLFDQIIDTLQHSQGLIIDLRNTPTSGIPEMSRGILSRFVSKTQPYQQHIQAPYTSKKAKRWLEKIEPRGKRYTKPVVVLVGRWTGGVAESLAMGFETTKSGHVIGTEMRRLAGQTTFFQFPNLWLSCRIPTTHITHIDGTDRRDFTPKHYVKIKNNLRDEILDEGLRHLLKNTSRKSRR